MLIYVSQLSIGKSYSDLIQTHNVIEQAIRSKGHRVLAPKYIPDIMVKNIKHKGLYILGSVFQQLSKCDGIYFNDFKLNHRVIGLEYQLALTYGLCIFTNLDDIKTLTRR